jgi:hypothetical protein
MDNPRQVDLVIEKHVIRYLHSTLHYGLRYVTDHEFGLYGYSDLDWVNIILFRKITSASCFSLGSNIVSWRSRKHSCVALSMVQAEYVASCVACREVV